MNIGILITIIKDNYFFSLMCIFSLLYIIFFGAGDSEFRVLSFDELNVSEGRLFVIKPSSRNYTKVSVGLNTIEKEECCFQLVSNRKYFNAHSGKLVKLYWQKGTSFLSKLLDIRLVMEVDQINSSGETINVLLPYWRSEIDLKKDGERRVDLSIAYSIFYLNLLIIFLIFVAEIYKCLGVKN